MLSHSGSHCTGNFLSRSALRQAALDININDVIPSEEQRLFPDITFTCNGFITKWIVGAEQRGTAVLQSELQIWRNAGGRNYTKTGFTLLTSPSSTPLVNVFEYNLNSPLEFHEGDILGLYQPQRQNSTLVVYDQQCDGPVNIFVEDGSAQSTVTLDTPHNQYDYPLVTVEISTGKHRALLIVLVYSHVW